MRSRIIASIAIGILFLSVLYWYWYTLPIMREIKDWQSIVAALIAYFVMGSVWVSWGFKVINWVNRK